MSGFAVPPLPPLLACLLGVIVLLLVRGRLSLSPCCVCVANRPLNSCCVAGTMNKPSCPARPTTWSFSGFLPVAVSVPHHANCPCTTSSKQAQGLRQPRLGLQRVLLIGLPVGGSFTAHQRSTSQGTHNNHDSDFRGPAVTVERRLRYVHDIADVTVSSLKAPGMPRPETTRTGSSLSKAWEGVNRRKSGPGASCLTGCRFPVYTSENAWWRFQEPNVAAAEANDLPPSTNDSAT